MSILATEAWLWLRDCFKILPFAVMQRIARVSQRQLSYRYLFGKSIGGLFEIPSMTGRGRELS